MKKTLVKTDKNGTKYWEYSCTCGKCNGTGVYRWQAHHYTGTVTDYEGECYGCHGTGIATWTEKEYTEAHAQKLAEQRAKRQAKKEAELEQKKAEMQEALKEIARKQAEREAKWQAEREASEYVGSVGDKITVEVTFSHEVSFDTQFGTQYIYFFKDEAGNTLAWKTSAMLWIDDLDENGNNIFIRKGDKIRFTASIKEHSEYKGEKQTMLSRVRKIEMVSKKKEETDKEKAEKQMASLEEGDQTWTMPYRQFKDHYSDCETVAGSYDDNYKTIKVIIRSGRMKASGTRDQHYAGYEFKNQNGTLATYRAVSFENALKRVQKEFPEDEWEINHIYFYERH